MTERMQRPFIPPTVINTGSYYLSYEFNYVGYSIDFWKSTLIRMGKMSKPDHVAHTLGAVTCAAGVAFGKDNGMYPFHSFSLDLPSELVTLITEEKIEGGIVGGGNETIDYPVNSKLFEKAGFTIVRPPSDDYPAFEILSVPKERKVFYHYHSL